MAVVYKSTALSPMTEIEVVKSVVKSTTIRSFQGVNGQVVAVEFDKDPTQAELDQLSAELGRTFSK